MLKFNIILKEESFDEIIEGFICNLLSQYTIIDYKISHVYIIEKNRILINEMTIFQYIVVHFISKCNNEKFL